MGLVGGGAAIAASEARRRRRWRGAASVVLLALVVRVWAAALLPVDFDEPDYLEAAYYYANALEDGNLWALTGEPGNPEHPALVKLLYGVAAWSRGPAAAWEWLLKAARGISVLFGVLTVLIVALFDPLGGGLLAVHTMTAKYTAQAYLEALPALAATAAVLVLVRLPAATSPWLWVSAAALGVMAASKLSYLPVLAPILFLTWQKRIGWGRLFAYAALAALVAFALDPTLWPDPVGRLSAMFGFHLRYSAGAEVARASYPWFQPILWLSSSAPAAWHPQVFFFGADGLIALLALAGLPQARRTRPWLVIWLASGLTALILWPTKWPQYTLALAPAICLCAGGALRQIWRWALDHEERWDWVKPLVPRLSPAFWVLLVAGAAALMAWYAVDRAALARGNRGWVHLPPDAAGLPPGTLEDLAAVGDGAIVATGGGAAIILAPTGLTADPEARALPGASGATAVAASRSEAWLIAGNRVSKWRVDAPGAPALVASFDPGQIGLPGARLTSLALSPGGEVWIGSDRGATRFDGSAWQVLHPSEGGLPSAPVYAIAPGSAEVWFGSAVGLHRYGRLAGDWRSWQPAGPAGSPSPVVSLAIASDGSIWAGTTGAGLLRWHGGALTNLTSANSGLPLNSVRSLHIARDGALWIGGAFALQPGGLLTRLQGEEWSTFKPERTGFSGSEPLAIAEDSTGRIWVGSRAGIDIFAPPPPVP
jgi:hypothetical protein